jgi:yecA family protein
MKGERKRIATRDRTALAAYLGRDGRPEGSLTLPEVYGFFFAVACGPDLVRPSEWIKLLLGLGEDTPIRDIEHANLLLGALQDVYNEVTGLARSDPARAPIRLRPAR